MNDQNLDQHLHAQSLFTPVSWKHFFYLGKSILSARSKKAASLTTHLPLEFQHGIYTNKGLAGKLIKFGDTLAALLQVKLYWENAPLLNFGSWELKHGQTEWMLVPKDIALCLDVGHLMLGTASKEEARDTILAVFRERQAQIKHLHIHENDLQHDIHNHRVGTIITQELLTEITAGRTYIFEK